MPMRLINHSKVAELAQSLLRFVDTRGLQGNEFNFGFPMSEGPGYSAQQSLAAKEREIAQQGLPLLYPIPLLAVPWLGDLGLGLDLAFGTNDAMAATQIANQLSPCAALTSTVIDPSFAIFGSLSAGTVLDDLNEYGYLNNYTALIGRIVVSSFDTSQYVDRVKDVISSNPNQK